MTRYWLVAVHDSTNNDGEDIAATIESELFNSGRTVTAVEVLHEPGDDVYFIPRD